MVYRLRASEGAANLPVEGFFLTIPFQFDNNGFLVLRSDAMQAAVLLTSRKEAEARFEQHSATLAESDGSFLGGTYELTDGNAATVTLHDFTPTFLHSGHDLFLGHSVVVFEGRPQVDGSPEHRVTYNPPAISKTAHHRSQLGRDFTWGGSIYRDEAVCLSTTYADYDFHLDQRSVASFLALGPSGVDGDEGLVSAFSSLGVYGDDGSTGEQAAPSLSFHDLRREESEDPGLAFFGDSANGRGEQFTEKGCVFICQGHFARLDGDELFSVLTSGSSRGIARALVPRGARRPIMRTLEKPKEEQADMKRFFEGIALWDLEPRADGPAKPNLL